MTGAHVTLLSIAIALLVIAVDTQATRASIERDGLACFAMADAISMLRDLPGEYSYTESFYRTGIISP